MNCNCYNVLERQSTTIYIGIDLEVIYHRYEKDRKHRHVVGTLIKNSKEIRKFQKELDAVDPKDFIEGRIIHKMTGVDKKVGTLKDLLDETYRYLLYKPPN